MNNYEYAGLWIRFGATFIDLTFVVIFALIPLSFIYGAEYWTDTRLIHGFWDLILNYIAPFVITIWFWLRFAGTPGKMANKIKIVDAKTGGEISFGQAVGRYLAYIPAILPFFMGIIWMGFDRRKQGWHDKLAGTIVVRKKEPVPFKYYHPEQ